MSDEEQAKAVAKRLGIPYASLDNKILRMQKGENLETIIPESFARKHLVLPLFMDGDVLAVAMADPGDAPLFDLIKLITGQKIQPFVASKTQLGSAIDRSY